MGHETITFSSFGKMAYAYRDYIQVSPSTVAYSVDVYRNERNIAEFLSQLRHSQLDKLRVQLTYIARVSDGDPPFKVYRNCWMQGNKYYQNLRDQLIMVITIHQIERKRTIITKGKIESYFLRKQYPHTDCRECPLSLVVVMENDNCTLCKKYRKILVWGGSPYSQIQQPIECLKEQYGYGDVLTLSHIPNNRLNV